MLLAVATIFLISCDKDDDVEKTVQSLIGKWYLYQEIETYSEGGDTETEEWTYDPSIDVGYFGAVLFEVTSESIIRYEYDSESIDGYYSETMTYEIVGDSIVFTYTDLKRSEEDKVKYYFDGNMLVFVDSYEDEYYDYSETYTQKFKQYKGELPPEEWSEGLTNDDYEPDDTYLMANTIQIGSSQTHVTIAGEEDWFQFSATSGETYLIQVSAYMDNYMYLYDTDGQTLLVDDDDNDSDIPVETVDGYNPVILWDCPESGTYYFKVTGYDESDEGSYSVKITTSDLTVPSKTSVKVDKKEKRVSFFNR